MENQKKTQSKPMPKTDKDMGTDKKAVTTQTDGKKSGQSKDKK